MNYVSMICAMLVATMAWSVHAVPLQINYQGSLASPVGVPLDTSVAMTFRMYNNSVGGAQLWAETHPSVTVTNGLFLAQLGSLASLTDVIFNQSQVWLGVTVGSNSEMTPRTQVASVAYSYYTSTVHAATGGAITGNVNIVGKGNIGTGNSNGGGNAFVVGSNNNASGPNSVITGGENNVASGNHAAVVSGSYNRAESMYTHVAGGDSNVALGDFSTINGGQLNQTSLPYSVISGGLNNSATGFNSTIGGGYDNVCGGAGAFLGGGSSNSSSGTASFLGGGGSNAASQNFSAVVCGSGNQATGRNSALVGGESNIAIGDFSFVGGGGYNRAHAAHSVIGGGGGIAEFDSNSIAPSGAYCFIGGGHRNYISNPEAVVVGGTSNHADGHAFVGGGYGNDASGNYSTIGGGALNTSAGAYSVIGAGRENATNDTAATVAGGRNCRALGRYSAVLGGGGPSAADSNTASGGWSTVLGGRASRATADYAVALGRKALAMHTGSIVITDGNDIAFNSTADNQCIIRASGGTTIYSAALPFSGVSLSAGGNAWVGVSDSTKKRDIRLTDTKAVLEKFAALPIKNWEYKSEAEGIEHIGPMAQDFWNAFRLGSDSLGIATNDADGVLFAAVQELAKQNDKLQTSNDNQEATIAGMKVDIAELRKMVQNLMAEKQQLNFTVKE